MASIAKPNVTFNPIHSFRINIKLAILVSP